MTERIPLWIDATTVPADAMADVEAAAKRVGCERILGDDGDVLRVTIRTAEDQETAAVAPGVVAIDSDDWTIIPLENLIAARRDRPGTLFAIAKNAEEALLFRDTLDIGVHGILLQPQSAQDVVASDAALRQRGARPDDSPIDAPDRPFLEAATLTRIEDAGVGDRVCVDCTSTFNDGEGLLVGSTARGFALVHAETIQTDYVNARPFRVNAGAIHSYLLGPEDRTQYLSEAAAGKTVLAVARDGATRTLTIGRAKIERRPHTLVVWETDDGRTGNAVLQTAETIRLVDPDGAVVSVTDLAPGQRIMVHTELAARHFGMAVKEKLIEQ